MKSKHLFFSLLAMASLILSTTWSQAQNPAISQGSHLISGLFSFTSQGGDMYEGYEEKRSNTFTLSPTYYNFIANQIGVGGTLSYTRSSSGDYSSSILAIGPRVGYFFDLGAENIPYVAAGVNYLSMGVNWDGEKESEGGFGAQVGGGIIIRKGHLGIIFEGGLNFESYKPEGEDEAITGNTIYVAVGLAGFLYQE